VQRQIAGSVSDTLQLRLGVEEHQRLERRDTDNSEAYQAYLRGTYFSNNGPGKIWSAHPVL